MERIKKKRIRVRVLEGRMPFKRVLEVSNPIRDHIVTIPAILPWQFIEEYGIIHSQLFELKSRRTSEAYQRYREDEIKILESINVEDYDKDL